VDKVYAMVNNKLFDNFFNVHKKIFLNPIAPFDGLEKYVATMHEDMFFFLLLRMILRKSMLVEKITIILLNVGLRLNSLSG
jgi:hypothetical protein